MTVTMLSEEANGSSSTTSSTECCPLCYEEMVECGPHQIRWLRCCGEAVCRECAIELYENEDCCPKCFESVATTGEEVEAWVESLSSRRQQQQQPSDSADGGEDLDAPAAAELDGARALLSKRTDSLMTGRMLCRIESVNLKKNSSADLSPETLRRVFEIENARIPLSDALSLASKARERFAKEPNVLDLEIPLLCVGDLHGQFEDLLTVLHGEGRDGGLVRARRQVGAFLDGGRKKGALLFLGDYVDRGSRGCEVFLYLLSLKLAHPDVVHLVRGNHESRSLTGHFGFRSECRRKYGMTLYHEICRVFESLPLAARCKGAEYGDVLCCHGGIGPSFLTVQDLQQIDRFVEPPDHGPLCDLLWADPKRPRPEDDDDEEDSSSSSSGALFEPNPTRGCSYVFTAEATSRFLRANNLAAIVRAHEVQEFGFAKDFCYIADEDEEDDGVGSTKSCGGGRRAKIAPVTTVFSAPNYCGKYGNDAAVLVLGKDRAEPVVFDAAPKEEETEEEVEVSDDEDEGDDDKESDVLRRAYRMCPYMPSSFRAIVECAKEMLDDDAVLVKKVAVARSSSLFSLPPPPSSSLPRSRSAGGLSSAHSKKQVVQPTLDVEVPETATSKWSLTAIVRTRSRLRGRLPKKSKRFSAALNGDMFNEMAPSAVVQRLRRTSCPQIAAFLAKTSFVDSGKSGKNTILDAQTNKITHFEELVEVRDELRASRRAGGTESRSVAAAADTLRTTPQYSVPSPPSPTLASPPPEIAEEGFSDQEVYALRLIFSLFDIDGSGSISREELASYAEEVDECISPNDISVCLAALDSDEDNEISLDDWVKFAAKLKAAWQLLDSDQK